MVQALWRRLDGPGHDAARIDTVGDRSRLWGHAAFAHGVSPVSLAYVVEMAASGEALSGRVRGFVGDLIVDQKITRVGDDWLLNGRPQGLSGSGHSGLVDLDFGFTPATNWQQLKRAGLAIGEEVRFDVAWLDVGALRIERLPQVYRRTGELTYAYEAPTFGYRATLTLAASGFVVDYPGLWAMETGAEALG